MERDQYEWPADLVWHPRERLACIVDVHRRAMVRLLASVFYFRVESISVTLSLRLKRFTTQRAALSLDHLNRVCVFSCMWIPHR